jgi:hypothetical protein
MPELSAPISAAPSASLRNGSRIIDMTWADGRLNEPHGRRVSVKNGRVAVFRESD